MNKSTQKKDFSEVAYFDEKKDRDLSCSDRDSHTEEAEDIEEIAFLSMN